MFDKKDGSKARFNEEETIISTGPFKMVEYVPLSIAILLFELLLKSFAIIDYLIPGLLPLLY